MILAFEDLIINIFVKVDNFYKSISPLINKRYFIENNNYDTTNKKRIYKSRMNTLMESEIITILILYQLSQYKNLKKFYNGHMNKILIQYFPKLPCYNRFLILERKVNFLLLLFIQYLLGKEIGIYYINSSPLLVCKNQRIHRHKTFKYLAEIGKSSMGWFYGFKLHLIINNKGESMNFKLTKGNVFDNIPIIDLINRIKQGGKLFGDKGYICKEEVKEKLKNTYNIELIIKNRRNIKNKQYNTLSEEDKRLLKKRNLIETVIGEIKRLTNITTTRIKNVYNYFTNVFSSILTY